MIKQDTTIEADDGSTISVLVVDDNASFCWALRSFLATRPGIETLGDVQSGSEACGMVSRLKPDLVLLDFVLSGMTGVEACRAIKSLAQAPKVIMISIWEEKRHRDRSVEAGADDYLCKNDLPNTLMPAIGRLFPTMRVEDEILPDSGTGGPFAGGGDSKSK